MSWLTWYEMLPLSLAVMCVCMGLTSLVTVTGKLDRDVAAGAVKTLGLMGGVLALAVSALVIWGVVGGAWPKALGYLGLAGGAAGLIGGFLARRHGKAAGIIMMTAGALSFITLAGAALLMSGGGLAAGRPRALTGKRAVVRILRIIIAMAIPALILADIFFKVSAWFIIISFVIFLVYLVLMIVDYVWAGNGDDKKGA